MDFFTFIVHVFAPHTRDFYSLERLWGDAERIEMTDEPPEERATVARNFSSAVRSAEIASCLAALPHRRRPSGRAPRAGVRGVRRSAVASLSAGRSAAPAGTRSSASRRRSAAGAAIPLPSWRVLSVDAARVCPRCRRRPSALTGSRAIGAYDGALRAIVHAFKYRGLPLAVARPGRAPARERRRPSCARRHRGSGAAPPQPAPDARLQPGARAGRRSSACRWSRPCGASARRHRRPTFRPRRGTATCGTRLRSGAGQLSKGCGSCSWTT